MISNDKFTDIAAKYPTLIGILRSEIHNSLISWEFNFIKKLPLEQGLSFQIKAEEILIGSVSELLGEEPPTLDKVAYWEGRLSPKSKALIGEMHRCLHGHCRVIALEEEERYAAKCIQDWAYFNKEYNTCPEPTIERIDDNNWTTRNAYGCLVLNSYNLGILDIDCNDKNSFAGSHEEAIDFIVLKHERMCPGVGMRLYQTYGGLRLIVSSQELEARENTTYQLANYFKVDYRYSALCRRQGTFRARLSPKPWRNSSSWEEGIEISTAHLIAQLGPTAIPSSLQTLIEFHDFACAEEWEEGSALEKPDDNEP